MLKSKEKKDTDVLLRSVPTIEVTDTPIPDEVTDLIAEATEVPLDQLLQSGVLRELPLLSSIVGTIKVYVYARDWLLQRNIWRFRCHLTDIDENKKQSFVSRLQEDEKYRERVGENLLLLLHRVDDIRKPELMARIFGALVEGKIDDLVYQKLSTAVDRIKFYNIAALRDFYSDLSDRELPDDDALQDLAFAGLVNTGVVKGLVFGPADGYDRNELGKLFIEIALESPA